MLHIFYKCYDISGVHFYWSEYILSSNWVNHVFSILFRTMEVGDLPDTFTYHAGMLHTVVVV